MATERSILFSWGVARPSASGAGFRSAAGRGVAGAARGAARALPGSCSGRPSPCFSTSGHWFGNSTATRRALCGFSPLDCQDKPKVDDDGKPVVSGTPQTGSRNFSRLSLLESKDPRVDGMVRQLREQGRVAGLRRAPRLRRQGRGQSRGRPAARPARPPAPTGESARRPASTGRPAKVKSWFGYGLHADTRYELPVAFSVTQASRAETKELNGDKLETPLLRCKDFSADRGLDSGPAKLWDRYGIRPLHAPRGRKRTTRPRQTRPLFDDNVYQRGEVLVLKPASNGTGFEADRGACGTLKYRCPAAAFGVDCAGRKECHRAAGHLRRQRGRRSADREEVHAPGRPTCEPGYGSRRPRLLPGLPRSGGPGAGHGDGRDGRDRSPRRRRCAHRQRWRQAGRRLLGPGGSGERSGADGHLYRRRGDGWRGSPGGGASDRRRRGDGWPGRARAGQRRRQRHPGRRADRGDRPHQGKRPRFNAGECQRGANSGGRWFFRQRHRRGHHRPGQGGRQPHWF